MLETRRTTAIGEERRLSVRERERELRRRRKRREERLKARRKVARTGPAHPAGAERQKVKRRSEAPVGTAPAPAPSAPPAEGEPSAGT